MGISLLEASKYNDGNVKRAGVISMFADTSDILRALTFMPVQGSSLSYTVEGQLPGVAFRGFNESYTPSTGIINPSVEVLRVLGGNMDVDRALIKTRGPDIRAANEMMKAKAIALSITDKVINGDSVANPREFDGLRRRITGSQLIPANLAAPAANSPLSLEALDAAIDAVEGANYLIMSKDARRKLSRAARSNIGGEIVVGTDAFGYKIDMYNGIPILIADYNDVGARIIDFNEVGPGGGTTSSSIYVVRIDDGYVTGLQNGSFEVDDLGLINDGVTYRTVIEWIVGLAVMHGRAAARVWGITNAPATA
jgi:hypothetical protein